MNKELLGVVVSVVKDKKYIREAKREQEKRKHRWQSVKGSIEYFAYRIKKCTKNKDRFLLKTPAGNNKGNLVLLISSYIRYRMLKNVTHKSKQCAKVYVFIFSLYAVSQDCLPKELDFM